MFDLYIGICFKLYVVYMCNYIVLVIVMFVNCKSRINYLLLILFVISVRGFCGICKK